MCDCITDVNKLLAGHNAELGVTLNMLTGKDYSKLVVNKIDPRKRAAPPLMIPTYCPFCGEPYETDQGVEEIPLDAAPAEEG